jgi:polyhydroxyalkanoate synthesis repressor PhaR
MSAEQVRLRIALRKYPNRRYYDAAQSRHVTLEEIHGMICDGAEVSVADSKTGEDITAKVLAQIILEHDAPKLAVFPVELLHQVIRANEPLVRDFMEKFFHQAYSLFMNSQRQFEQYLRDALALRTPFWNTSEWARLMLTPLAPMLSPPGSAREDVAGAPRQDESAQRQALLMEQQELRRLVGELQEQVKTLREVAERPNGHVRSP